MKGRIIFIGAVNKGGVADDGETMKNRILINAISKHAPNNVIVVDTRNKTARFFHIVKYVFLLLFARNAKLVFSASSFVTYKLIRIAHRFDFNSKNIYYWVIGGKYADFVEQGRINKGYYLDIKQIFVEGESMRQKLILLGYGNVSTFPNFKEISYMPMKSATTSDNMIRFVFLSRIIPQKGVDIIIDAALRLNRSFSDKFIVDFMGKIDTSYESEFLSKIQKVANINYKGFLNLTQNVGYDILASYDVMLFPTFWEGEGFPGIIIDAYIAGLPIIASDWNLNSQIVKEGITGYIIPAQDTDALVDIMHKCINGDVDLRSLSKNSQLEAGKYNVDSIINNKFLKHIGLI